MTDNELIEKIISLYKEARVTTYIKKNIKRGRSHSISSRVEDLFAVYISEMLPENVEILIDQPFTYHSDKTYAMYPDIAVIRNNEVVKLFDIKMDLGWNRDFYPFCKEKQEFIDEIKGLQVKAKDGATKEQKTYKISDSVKINIVIVSNANISKTKREENEKRILTLDKSKIEVFVLADAHPNNYDDDDITNIPLRQVDIENLKREIKLNI